MFSHLPGDSKIHRGVSTMPINVHKTNEYELRGGLIMEIENGVYEITKMIAESKEDNRITEDRTREILKEIEEKYTTEELKHIWIQLGFSRYQKRFFKEVK
jgi:butyrate kinase